MSDHSNLVVLHVLVQTRYECGAEADRYYLPEDTLTREEWDGLVKGDFCVLRNVLGRIQPWKCNEQDIFHQPLQVVFTEFLT